MNIYKICLLEKRKTMNLKDLGKQLLQNKTFRTVFISGFSMGWNILYAFFHCVLAVIYQSYWFFTMFVYYAILGLMRGITLRDRNNVLKYCGIGMLGLSVVVVGLIYLSIAEVRNKTYHLIVILGITIYTFCLIIHAVIEMIRSFR